MSSFKMFSFKTHSIKLHILTLVLGLGLGLGCGYGFQAFSQSSLYHQRGIDRIFVSPVENQTDYPEVENLVYNNMIRALASQGKIILVNHPELADAVLKSRIVTASFGVSASTQVASLRPDIGSSLETKDFTIASEYLANLSCAFSLIRTRTVPEKSRIVWASTIARSKPFPASNQLDVPGTTSALINESEFKRALSELARGVMDDLNQRMFAGF